jgi:serine/threonine protein kinase
VALSPPTRIGPYEVTELLGVGGMGEVYCATDTNLKRQVAIKILPVSVADDAERLARFQREAEVLAALNHPNIAHVHGLEKSDGMVALVMELVEGPTLADLIARGPIPLDEALPIAKQIAEGLEAAHEQGIIHRDLKPANIKVRDDGTVKILDFGLAKALEPRQPSGINATQSPTITTPAMMTGVGVILGTAAYMSPEQARGRTVDKRTDIWAFGSVLFEMIAGRRAFAGDDVSDTLANVLKTEPAWNVLPARTPEHVRRILNRCLEKDPTVRLHDIADARIEIGNPLDGTDGNQQSTPSHRVERSIWALAVLAALIVVAIATVSRTTPEPAEIRLEMNTGPSVDAAIALSPDGRHVVFNVTAEGRSDLWLRPLDTGVARRLEGTASGHLPFWSPDGRSIGFFADGKMKRTDVATGSVETVAVAFIGRGGTWNRNGTIVFAPTTVSPLFRIDAAGDSAREVTRLEAGEVNHRSPWFLPDGRHFLYFVLGSPARQGVYVGDLNGGRQVRLLGADGPAVYSGAGYVLFPRQGTLFAQRFDAARVALSGDPIAVARPVTVETQTSTAPISASDGSAIVFRAGSGSGTRQFVVVDRNGNRVRAVGEADPIASLDPEVAADGRRVAVNRFVDGNTDVWLIDMARGMLSRLTYDPSIDAFPIWSPDGNRIVFNSSRRGQFDLYVKASGGGPEDLVLQSPQIKAPMDWSRDGRFILYRSLDPQTGWDLWALPMSGDQKPIAIARGPFDERDGQFSPDGHWVAFQSDESGRVEIYVQRFPVANGKERVSTSGGTQVRWRPDSRELYYISPDLRLMAVPLRFDSSGAIQLEPPVPLFATSIGEALPGIFRQQYAVMNGGQQFLMNVVVDSNVRAPISVIANWKPHAVP